MLLINTSRDLEGPFLNTLVVFDINKIEKQNLFSYTILLLND